MGAPREQSPAPVAHCGEDASMLKSLLLDRMKRKRSSSIETDANSKKSTSMNIPKVSKPVTIPEQPQDILRKRLLGWVDPPAPKESPKQERTTAPVVTPRSQEPSANRLQSQAGKNLNQQEESVRTSPAGHSPARISPPPINRPEGPNDSRENKSTKKETSGAKKENTVTYANTSVLKHLLHRYTEMNQ